MLVRRIAPPSIMAPARAKKRPPAWQPAGGLASMRGYWIEATAASRIGGIAPLAS
jgi:hypothetical protein